MAPVVVAQAVFTGAVRGDGGGAAGRGLTGAMSVAVLLGGVVAQIGVSDATGSGG